VAAASNHAIADAGTLVSQILAQAIEDTRPLDQCGGSIAAIGCESHHEAGEIDHSQENIRRTL
jgi:hypothetical protein